MTDLSPHIFIQEMLSTASEIFEASLKFKSESSLHGDQFLSDNAKSMRWFLLPWEAQDYLSPCTTHTHHTPPFKPKDFRNYDSQLSTKPVAVATTVTTTMPQSVTEVVTKNSTVVFHSPPKIIFKPTTEVRARLSPCTLGYLTTDWVFV